MAGPDGLRDQLAGLAAAEDSALGPATAALIISALDRVGKSRPEDYFPHFYAIASGLAESGANTATARAGALAEVMGARQGYRLDHRDDDDVCNASLMWVIDNRRGIAETLGILALEGMRRAGWPAEVLAFPPRFLLRLTDPGGGRVIVDPGQGWRPVEAVDLRALLKASAGLAAELAPGHWAAQGNRDILLRLQTETKMRLLRCGCVAQALAVVETMLLYAPDRSLLWREAGLMHVRLEQLPAAVAALEQFLARGCNANARRRTLELLQEIKGRMK